MKVLFGFPGWGWKMYGLSSFRSGGMWFLGFSKQLPTRGADDTTIDLNKCPQCGGEADEEPASPACRRSPRSAG